MVRAVVAARRYLRAVALPEPLVRWLMTPEAPDVELVPRDFLTRPPWQANGACREHPVDVFFPRKGASAANAKAICAACPVRSECLNYALSDPGIVGVWGATTERERKRMRSVRLRAAG